MSDSLEHLDLGQRACSRKLWAQAVEHLTRGLEHEPSAGHGSMLGESLRQLGRHAEALRALREARRSAPPGFGHFLSRQMAEVFVSLGRFHSAERWYGKATEEAPHDAGGWIVLGHFLRHAGRLVDAESSHRRAVEVADPGLLDEAWFNLGLDLRAQGRYAEARECLETAIRFGSRKPENRTALTDVSRAMVPGSSQGSHRKGVRSYQRGLSASALEDLATGMNERVDPGVHWIWVAMCLRALCRHGEALLAVRRARPHLPLGCRDLAYSELGEIDRARGRFRSAERWFRRAVEDAPLKPLRWWYLSDFYLDAGRLSDAEASSRRALALSKKDASDAWLNLGLSLRGQGRYREARHAFEQALRGDPRCAQARQGLRDVTPLAQGE